MKSTPITFMEQTTAIQPLQQRRQAKVLLQAEKYKCLPDHPMKEKGEGHTKNIIKRSNFTHEVKNLQKVYPAVLTIPTLPLSKQDFANLCENTTSEIQINTTIPQLDQGKELDASVRHSIALVNIAEIYPPATWTRVYTDGSATKATTDGGAGIIIQYPSGATQTSSSATGKHRTNYRAETEALKQAATLVKDSPTVFLTDALSVLEALQTNKSPLLATQMQELGNTYRVVLQWIPSQCGIPGNEQAGQLSLYLLTSVIT